MTKHDQDKLFGVHPTLATQVQRLIDAMDALGYILTVTDGLRTLEEQQALYAKGRTTPGPIVTYSDGINKPSNHQAKLDGYGHAVDCAWRLADGSVSWDLRMPFKAYGSCAEALGLTWGGNWAKLVDLPHIEMV